MFRNRMLGGISHLALFAPETGAGAAAAPGGTTAAAAPGAGGATAAPGAAAAAPGATAVPAAGATDGGTAAAAAAAPGATTLAGSGATEAAAAAAALKPGELPKDFDFRAYLAKGDKDAEKDLAKYTDLPSMYKSLRELQGKISKGELKAAPAPLPENATDEQKAQWRKDNGLPETVEAMVTGIKLPDGVVIGEADKPLLSDFAKSMFENGASQAEMNRAVQWFYGMQDKLDAQRAEADGGHKQTAMEALMGEWGPQNFKANMNAMNTVLAGMPEDLKVEMLSARTPDGRMIGNTPGFIKWAAQIARDINPAATLVTPGADSMKSVDSEIAAIESKMYLPDGKENPEYWRGQAGEAMQSRYRELIDAKRKMANRGAQAA